MNIKQTLCAIALTAFTALGGCAHSPRHNDDIKTELTGYGLKIGYALKDAPTIGWMNGFGLGTKFYFETKKENNEDDKKTNSIEHSSELNFNGTFGDNNLYEFGVTEGIIGGYGKKADIELKLGALRMGVVSTGDVLWTPEIGAELRIGGLFVDLKGQGYVGKEDYRGFRFGLNSGLIF